MLQVLNAKTELANLDAVLTQTVLPRPSVLTTTVCLDVARILTAPPVCLATTTNAIPNVPPPVTAQCKTCIVLATNTVCSVVKPATHALMVLSAVTTSVFLVAIPMLTAPTT